MYLVCKPCSIMNANKHVNIFRVRVVQICCRHVVCMANKVDDLPTKQTKRSNFKTYLN